jgi:hypothetical protein
MTREQKRARMAEISQKIRDHGVKSVTADERAEYLRLDGELTITEPEGRVAPAKRNDAKVPEVRGVPSEPIRVGQAREWVERAAENGVRVTRSNGDRGIAMNPGRDFDLNAYWGQKLGLAKRGAEVRALAETLPTVARPLPRPHGWLTTLTSCCPTPFSAASARVRS